MRKLKIAALLALALCLVAATWAVGATYLVYEKYGGTWQDANKSTSKPDDDLMCWAAAASNVLAWGGWGTKAYSTAQAIFQYTVDHWTNRLGWARNVWKWWFNGSSPPVSSYAYVDVQGGGNFYPHLNVNDYYHDIYNNLMATIDRDLNSGYGIALTIYRLDGGYGHVVTCWGLDYELVGTNKNYKGIYITDSDDGLFGQVYYPLVWANNLWQLGGRYQGWYLSSASALLFNPFAPQDQIVTPLPSSLVLLSTALALGLALRRHKNRL